MYTIYVNNTLCWRLRRARFIATFLGRLCKYCLFSQKANKCRLLYTSFQYSISGVVIDDNPSISRAVNEEFCTSYSENRERGTGNPGTRESGNAGTGNRATGEPRNDGTGEPGNEGTREQGNRGTREPGNEEAGTPGND